VAYDWYLLEHALPLIYNAADMICLSVDKDRISWSGHPYAFDTTAFQQLVARLDPDKKIRVIEEDYHLPDLTPMQNEVRQRNRIAQHFGPGGWFVQLDCDEYFLDFDGFVEYLRSLTSRRTKRANVACAWIILYKQTPEGFLYVDPVDKTKTEFMQIATREPGYEYGRRNGNFNIITNFAILHQSWARSREEIRDKIYNWGHSTDFDKEKYFAAWEGFDAANFATAKDIHPLQSGLWPRLNFVKGKTIADLLKNFPTHTMPAYSTVDLFFRNSRLFSKLRSLLKK